MTARFRIRTAAGQEVSFATKEMFEDFVRSGDLSPDDLVYDRDTGSWSSARTHPAVVEIQYEKEPEAGSEGGVPSGGGRKRGSGAEKPAPDAEKPARAPEKRAPAPEEPAPAAEETAPAAGKTGAADSPVAGAGDRPEEPEGADVPHGDAGLEESPPAGTDVELDFDFQLTEAMSPEESKRIFLEQLEAERRADIDAGESVQDSLSGFTINAESMGQGLQDRPPASARQRRPRATSSASRRDPSTGRAEPGRGGASRRRSPSGSRAGTGTGASAGTRTGASKGGGLGRGLLLLLLLGLLAAGGYVAYEVFVGEAGAGGDDGGADTAEAAEVDAASVAGRRSPDEGATGPAEIEPSAEGRPMAGDAGPRPGAAEPSVADGGRMEEGAGALGIAADSTEAGAGESGPEPVIPATESAIRGRAHERYLAATQRLLRDLEPIPDVWPTGPYLSVPSDHPEVVDAWQDYISTIQAVRPGDEERYRVAYEAALDDAAVTGEAREERLERGMAEFAETEGMRQAHFDRVEALARAALQSHNALIEVEGMILYDATGSTGRQEGVGRGTSARDAESRLVLDQVIELLEVALDADGEGPGSGENVREWVWDGFLDAATR